MSLSTAARRAADELASHLPGADARTAGLIATAAAALCDLADHAAATATGDAGTVLAVFINGQPIADDNLTLAAAATLTAAADVQGRP